MRTSFPAASWTRRVATRLRRRIRYWITRSGYLFGAALILVGVAAVASGNNLLFLILAAMLATLMISGFVSRLSLAGLELELILPEHISARQPVTARLKLRNLKWFPSFAIHLAATAGDEPPVMQHEIVYPVLPGRSAFEASAGALFPRRGVHQENLFTLSTRFPFGFVERKTAVSIRTEVVIYPSLEPSFLASDLLAQLRGEIEREQRGLGSDFYRLRPYEFHESARYVDWRSSAHTGELQVREFAREERSIVYLFFDLSGQPGDDFERAVECCAYLVWMLSNESVRIRFRTQLSDLTFPDEVTIYEILRTLALASPLQQPHIPLPDHDDPQIVFTQTPFAFAETGWRATLSLGLPKSLG